MRSNPLLPIFLIVFVDILGFSMFIPLLPFYAKSFGASDFTVGLLLTSYAICQFFAGPVLGKLSDQYGRKPLLIISQLGTLAGFILLAATHSLALIFLARIIDGITAGNLSLAQAYIADVAAPEKRAQSFGIIGIAFGIGFTIGPGISGWLAQYSYVYPILAACGLSATSILCTTFLLPAGTPRAKDAPQRLGVFDLGAYAEFFRRPGLGGLLLEFLCFAFSFAIFFSGFALFGQQRLNYGPTQVGNALLAIGILAIIMQSKVLGILVKKFGELRVSRTGFLVSAVGSATVAVSYSTPPLIGGTSLLSVGSGVVRPTVTSLITRKAGPYEQGTVLGVTQSLQSIAQILGPLMATSLIQFHQTSAWALLSGAFMLAGFAFSAGARKAEC